MPINQEEEEAPYRNISNTIFSVIESFCRALIGNQFSTSVARVVVPQK